MEFLRQQPIVSLADGEPKTFIAEFPQSRPKFDHAKLWSETYSADVVKKIKALMQRKNCAVSWIQFVVDQHGFLIIVCFEHSLILGDAKRATKVLLRCLPFEATPCAAAKGLRPLDEVDADRIRAWQTIDTLRPRGKKRAREESDDEEEVRFVKPKQELVLRKAEPPPKSAGQLLAELSDESSSEEEVPPPRLMLTNGPAEANDHSDPDFHGRHQCVGTPR